MENKTVTLNYDEYLKMEQLIEDLREQANEARRTLQANVPVIEADRGMGFYRWYNKGAHELIENEINKRIEQKLSIHDERRAYELANDKFEEIHKSRIGQYTLRKLYKLWRENKS